MYVYIYKERDRCIQVQNLKYITVDTYFKLHFVTLSVSKTLTFLCVAQYVNLT